LYLLARRRYHFFEKKKIVGEKHGFHEHEEIA
jgi:hypothetical protein